MKLATYNANSVRARLPLLCDWLRRERPDLLLVQETKVRDEAFPVRDFEDQGYQVVSRGQKAYNGVALISRRPCRRILRDLFSEGDTEARFLSASFDDIPVINVYVPQGFQVGSEKFEDKLKFLETLLAHVTDRYRPEKPLIVAGDLNVALEPVDVFDPEGLEGEVGFHAEERAVLRRFMDWGLHDVFRKHHPEGGHFTFWDYRVPNAVKRRMGWRVDYILATEPLSRRCSNAWIDVSARMLPKPSDHTFLVAEFDLGDSG